MTQINKPQEPLITVLMSAYNSEHYLREAVDSILGQTFSDFIFLIIDDASTDSTPQILASYAKQDPRVKIVTNETNLGLTASLNKGIALISTPYIARMDADDISLPQRLELQLAYLEQHPDVAVVGSKVQFISNESSLMDIWDVPITSQEIRHMLQTKENCICHSSVLIRTSVLKQVCGYRECFSKAQDYDLWLRILDISQISNLPAVLHRYRKHSDSISQTSNIEQGVHHVLAMQSAERRREGRPDPLGQAIHSPDLIMSLLGGGAYSTFMWLFILTHRKYENKAEYLKNTWLFVLPHADIAQEVIDIPGLWYLARQQYPKVAEAVCLALKKQKRYLQLYLLLEEEIKDKYPKSACFYSVVRKIKKV